MGDPHMHLLPLPKMLCYFHAQKKSCSPPHQTQITPYPILYQPQAMPYPMIHQSQSIDNPHIRLLTYPMPLPPAENTLPCPIPKLRFPTCTLFPFPASLPNPAHTLHLPYPFVIISELEMMHYVYPHQTKLRCCDTLVHRLVD